MTEDDGKQVAVVARDVPVRTRPSVYPEPFASRMAGRSKRQLGDVFELANFGVNLTELAPGSESALLHRHSRQDEFIYILEGNPTLVTESGEIAMAPGMCAGFPAGGRAHQLQNRSDSRTLYLEVGDRTAADTADYPNDDIRAELDASGQWVFTHKDGRPYRVRGNSH
ncbi:MAG: cupin domain-containing protein [Rhodospirillaceae bacterium]|nr:cupin domain-containing protein [Rhodospirillaceae bacterium]MBT5945165.1 cupin domain-containing protein [Rhodospirillaceae bacterium]MBT6402834.1 cupin domain-containing protein [Rhodospirillaceae bacterium]MBT6534816.1 cupin domain-containing protein [Rhodospirillaceae bacterium]MBT7360941.1 cupin domain-containing protein [Rhodospirillaceae bacterium]